MNYINRPLVCQRLKLGVSQSYRIIGATESGLFTSDSILKLINDARVNISEIIKDIPTDIMTEEELAESLKDSGITTHQVKLWTSSRRLRSNVCPHFRFNQYCRRFSRAIVLDWLGRKSRPK